MKEATVRSFSFIEPMKALPVDKLPEGDRLYEIKHDGYRALALKDGKEVRLVNRSGNHEWLSKKYLMPDNNCPQSYRPINVYRWARSWYVVGNGPSYLLFRAEESRPAELRRAAPPPEPRRPS